MGWHAPMFLHLNSTAAGYIALAIASSYTLTAIAKVVARRTGMLDTPDGRRKAHSKPMPLLGGAALFLAFLTTVCVARWKGWEWLIRDTDSQPRVAMLLFSAGLFCLVGLWDDRRAMRPRTKLICQVLASLPFVFWGRSLESVHIFGTEIELTILGPVFTIFWLVACTNIVNLVDGLDGLAGTIGLIVCVTAAGLSEMQGSIGAMALAWIFAGALFGFLLHNWPPASIYLGDAGSLMIGFVIGALSIESSLKKATGFALAIPLVLVSVPVFDTFMAIVRRKLSGRGIGEADRGHIHHCLQNRGLSRAKSLLVIAALCVAMAAVTLVSAYFQNDLLALGLCLTILGLLIAGRVFGYNETVLFFRYFQALSTLLAGTSGVLRTQLFLARMARGESEQPIHHWNEVTKHVAELGGVHLEFVFWNESTQDVICRLKWHSEEPDSTQHPAWQFNYSVPGTGGLRATLTACGQSRNNSSQRRLVDLFRVFDTFCQSWSNAPPIPVSGSVQFPTPPLTPAWGNFLPTPNGTDQQPLTSPVANPAPVPPQRRAA